MESILYDKLKTLGVPVLPVGPGSTDVFDTTTETLPSILYRRLHTHTDMDLTYAIRVQLITVEIIVSGNSYAEAWNITESIKTLLHGYTNSGYEFTFYDQFGDQKYPSNEIHSQF